MIGPVPTVDFPTPLAIVLQLGESGSDEIIEAGVITFGLVGISLLYLHYFQPEMETGPMLRNLGFGCLILALLSLIWPWRPWPT